MRVVFQEMDYIGRVRDMTCIDGRGRRNETCSPQSREQTEENIYIVA
jgi:hypothetical protein